MSQDCLVHYCFVVVSVGTASIIAVFTFCLGSLKWKTTLMALPVFGSMPKSGGVTRGVTWGFSSGGWSV